MQHYRVSVAEMAGYTARPGRMAAWLCVEDVSQLVANRLPILSPLEKGMLGKTIRRLLASPLFAVVYVVFLGGGRGLRLADKLPTEGLTSHHLVEADQLPDQVLML